IHSEFAILSMTFELGFQRACFGSSSPVMSALMKAWLSRKPRDEEELLLPLLQSLEASVSVM
ncbi:hypothetical protein AVEN_243991-1, partial [Araneus ventricosus]